MKYKKFSFSMRLTLVSLLVSGLFVFSWLPIAAAAPDCSGTATATPGVTGKTDIDCADAAATCKSDDCDLVKKYLNPTINLLASLVGIVAVIAIIAGGIQYSSSGGDPQKAAKAKGHIVNAVLAVVVFLILYAFLQWLIPGGLN